MNENLTSHTHLHTARPLPPIPPTSHSGILLHPQNSTHQTPQNMSTQGRPSTRSRGRGRRTANTTTTSRNTSTPLLSSLLGDSLNSAPSRASPARGSAAPESDSKISAAAAVEFEDDFEGLGKDGNSSDESSDSSATYVMSMSDSQVTQKLFRQFGLSAGASSVQSSAESGSYGRTEDMVSANQLGKLQCLVCMERVRRQDAVWSCSYCYHVFHLLCIQQWARRCEDNTKLLRMKEVFPDMDVSWYCPQCRGGFSVKRDGLPESYDCFCGKVRDPVDDKWVTPHSCGQLCEKPLAGACEHSCTLLCHPGPCPPCPQQVEMACFCGKTSSSRRCGEPGYTCGQQCRKVLSCGAHRCEAECHDGPCPPCANTSLQTCRCGAVTERRPCAELDFTCGRVCGRPLPCGKHTCPLTCHDGDCASCPNEGARTCPCGRQPVDGIACDEPAPTCGETCDKELACGLHTCQRMCHHGDCGECTQLVNKQCACGRSTQSVPCSEEFKYIDLIVKPEPK